MSDRFWFFSTAFVPADLADDAAKWYAAERLEQHLSVPGCSAAWLLGTITHKDTHGTAFPNVIAVYEVAEPVSFSAGVFETSIEWGEFAPSLTDAKRLTRRVLCEYAARPEVHDVWASVRINFVDLPHKDRLQEVAFNEWYDTKHVPEICAFPGFSHAWRLARTGRRLHVPYDEDYWAIYAVDEPATLMKPVLNPWWDGVWQNNVEPGSLARSYHRVLEHLEK